MNRGKFYVVLMTRQAGMPHNLRVETTADTEAKAFNNAVYLLRQHGHAAFNVSKMQFRKELARFRELQLADPSKVALLSAPGEELWERSMNLRAFLPPRDLYPNL